MQNYTASGFKKEQGTRIYFKLIKEFWDKNKDSDKPGEWGESVTPTRKYLHQYLASELAAYATCSSVPSYCQWFFCELTHSFYSMCQQQLSVSHDDGL
jgi:hypothetical protein